MSESNDGSIDFYPRTRRLVGLIIAFLLLVLIFGVALAQAISQAGMSGHPLWKSLVGGSAEAFFLFVGLVGVYRSLSVVVRGLPLLSVSSDGLTGTGNVTGVSDYFRWHEIDGLRLSKGSIVIDFKRPAEVISRYGLLRRALMHFNHWFTGSPVVLNATLISMPMTDLVRLIEEKRLSERFS